jgi:hypothetical protein
VGRWATNDRKEMSSNKRVSKIGAITFCRCICWSYGLSKSSRQK